MPCKRTAQGALRISARRNIHERRPSRGEGWVTDHPVVPRPRLVAQNRTEAPAQSSDHRYSCFYHSQLGFLLRRPLQPAVEGPPLCDQRSLLSPQPVYGFHERVFVACRTMGHTRIVGRTGRALRALDLENHSSRHSSHGSTIVCGPRARCPTARSRKKTAYRISGATCTPIA